MNCTQCGALIDEGKKFCTQCGARIEWEMQVPAYERSDEMLGQYEEKEQEIAGEQALREARAVKKIEDIVDVPKRNDYISEPVPSQKERHYETRKSRSQVIVNEELELGGSTGIVGFAELLATLMAHPMTTGPLLYSYFDKNISCIYAAILVILNSCITYLSFGSISSRIAELFYDVFDYFFGYGTVQYFLGEIGVQVLILSLISSILFIGCIIGCILGLYRGMFKVDIEWVECIQLLLMPLVFAFFGKVIIFAVALVSTKLVIVLGVILSVLVGILTMVQFINRLGISARVVYTIPLIYLFSLFIKYLFVFQIIKGYL